MSQLTKDEVIKITDDLTNFDPASGFYMVNPKFKDGYWQREVWYSRNSYHDELEYTLHLQNGIVYRKNDRNSKRQQVSTYTQQS